MALALDDVEPIFAKMVLTYGHHFLARWDGLPLDAVKADWARELARFAGNPAAIHWGLAHLPEGRPPTVLEFRTICARRPEPGGLPPPTQSAHPRVVAAALAGLRGTALQTSKAAPRHGRDLRWAARIVARAQAGEPVGHYALKQAQAALAATALPQEAP